MSIKLSAEDARWHIREGAWSFQERVLWRASDGARAALRRALRAVSPLQRLIQTRLVWPLADHLDGYGVLTRTAVATVGVAAALAAGAAGVMVAGSGEGAPARAAAAVIPQASDTGASLHGVPPNFVADPNASTTTAAAAKPAPPPPGGEGSATEPGPVAWNFARAFVLYEVGKVDDEAARTFDQSATKPLASALSDNPPRLPEGDKVPEAQVLNVVLGEQDGKRMSASVSLLRLEAASELRLTLQETDKGWRVAGVLG
jgi:hypothetical protein